MTFADLLTAPPPPADLRGLWLVFSADLAAAAVAKQALGQHRIAPVFGPDGRAALCADLITEIHPGGLYHATFAALDPSTFAGVEVLPIADLVAAGWFASSEEI